MNEDFTSSPEEVLGLAAGEGNLEEVCRLLGAGADPNWFDEFGWTALHHAVEVGQLEVIRLLLSRGAKVNAHDERIIGRNSARVGRPDLLSRNGARLGQS